MKKATCSFVFLFSFACLPGSSGAEMCTLDVVPAATLLVPYFEADISDSEGDGIADCTGGVQTIVRINNAWPDPALAHVSLWTDWSFPSVDFDVFLTGYDVQSFDLCQVLGRGNLPVTADEDRDPSDTISPAGDPDWDGTFASCAGPPPFFPFPEPALSLSLLNRVQNAHAGYTVPGLGGCAGEELNGVGACSGGSCPPGTIARGYITIDSVDGCSTLFPFDTGYFESIANTENRLWGSVFLIDYDNRTTAMEPLVHIEADDNFDATSTASSYTFYGRYTQALGGIDHREPLGSAWGATYFSGFDSSTDFVVWRDSTSSEGDISMTWGCGSDASAGPDWRPLPESQVACFDESETLATICGSAGDAEDCFPLETQKLRVGEGDLTPPFPFGWCYLNLNIPEDAFDGDVDFPADPPGIVAQSYVSTIHTASSDLAGGLRAVTMTGACLTDDLPLPGIEGVFEDGFESGDISGWRN